MTSVSFFTLWRSSRLPRTTDTAPDQRRCTAVHRHPQGAVRRPQRAPQAVHTRAVRFVGNAAHDTPEPMRATRQEGLGTCTRTADGSPVSPRCGMLSPCRSPRSGRSPSTAAPSAATAWWHSSAASAPSVVMCTGTASRTGVTPGSRQPFGCSPGTVLACRPHPVLACRARHSRRTGQCGCGLPVEHVVGAGGPPVDACARPCIGAGRGLCQWCAVAWNFSTG